MIERVISGGQTGADQAGWRAAKAAGIATGGWMPKGFLTEEGNRPEFAEMYGAQEHNSREYPPRTRANVLSADATLWFGSDKSAGAAATIRACQTGPRWYLIVGSKEWPHDMVSGWIAGGNRYRDRGGVFKILNVAGNRESSAPGIGAWVETYLAEVFRILTEATP